MKPKKRKRRGKKRKEKEEKSIWGGVVMRLSVAIIVIVALVIVPLLLPVIITLCFHPLEQSLAAGSVHAYHPIIVVVPASFPIPVLVAPISTPRAVARGGSQG